MITSVDGPCFNVGARAVEVMWRVGAAASRGDVAGECGGQLLPERTASGEKCAVYKRENVFRIAASVSSDQQGI